MDGVGFSSGFFFSFYTLEGFGFLIKNGNTIHTPTGFCICKGNGWSWISGKICCIIHILVGFEQFIFCSCLDFFRFYLYLWKTLDFQLDFSMTRSSIGKSMDFFLFQTRKPSIGVWKILEIQLDFSVIRSSTGKSMDFFSNMSGVGTDRKMEWPKWQYCTTAMSVNQLDFSVIRSSTGKPMDFFSKHERGGYG